MRISELFHLALVLGACTPGVLQAQPFADDFESGTLLTADVPAGKWANQGSVAGYTAAASSAAAHRGSFGFRLTDATSTNGSGVAVDQALSVTSGDFYVRFWHRLTSSNGLGEVVASQVDNTGGSTALDWFEMISAGQQRTGGDTDTGNLDDPAQTSFGAGGWHLIELAVLGVGSASGVRQLAVDGTVVSTSSPSSLAAQSVNQVELGEPFTSVGTFQGTLDFDDYRVDRTPHASRFSWSTLPFLLAGTCVPLTLRLVDSFQGADAAAPYDFSANLSLTGGGALFSDDQCQNGTSSVGFSAGQTNASLFFRADAAGSVDLTASFADFLDGSAWAQVDEETLVPPYRVGCACRQLGTGAAVPWVSALGFYLLATSSRRSKRGAVYKGLPRPLFPRGDSDFH